MRIAQRLLVAALGVVLVTIGAVGPAGAQTGKDQTGWLGVYTQNLTNELREGMNYNGDGVLINRVISDSPAAQAGLEEGDVITAIAGRSVSSPGELADLIQQRRPGTRVVVRLVRDGRTRTINVTLSERPSSDESFNWRRYDGDEGGDGFTWRRDEQGDEGSGDSYGDEPHVFHFNGDELQIPEIDIPEILGRFGRGRLGVRVESLSDDLARYFQVRDGKGVLVLEVMKDTPAEKAGLKAGDVILEVDGNKVDDSDELVRELRSHDEGKVSLSIVRNGSRQTIDAELDKAPRAFSFRNPDGNTFDFRFDNRTRDRLRNRVRDEQRRVRERTRDQERDMRNELQELRQELRELKRELQQLRDEG